MNFHVIIESDSNVIETVDDIKCPTEEFGGFGEFIDALLEASVEAVTGVELEDWTGEQRRELLYAGIAISKRNSQAAVVSSQITAIDVILKKSRTRTESLFKSISRSRSATPCKPFSEKSASMAARLIA